MKTPTHIQAKVIIKATGIKQRTFYDRVTFRQVRFIKPFNTDRLWDVKHWNKLNPDYVVPDELPD